MAGEETTTATHDAKHSEDQHVVEAEKEQQAPYRKLFQFADTIDYILMFFGTLGSLAAGSIITLFSLFFGDLIDVLSGNSEKQLSDVLQDQVNLIALEFAILGIGAFILCFFEVAFWSAAGHRQNKKLRRAYIVNMLRQEMGFFDAHEGATLLGKLQVETVQMQSAMGEKVGQLFHFSSTFMSSFILGMVLGWQLSLVVLGCFPLLAGAIAMVDISTRKATKEALDSYVQAGAVAEETLSGIRTVKHFGGEERAADRYISHLGSAEKAGVKSGFMLGTGLGTMSFTIMAFFGLSMWFGGWLIANGVQNGRSGKTYTAGDVIAVMFAQLIGAFSLGQLSGPLTAISKGRAAGYSVLKNLKLQSKIDALSEEGQQPAAVQGNISFRDISFRYPARMEVQILKGFSLEVLAGQTVALVGESGCGKSTAMQLLVRFYDPEAGSVLLDGTDIRSLNVRWLRRQIGIVSQEPVLFNFSIRDNIRHGRSHQRVSDAEVEAAAADANAHNFIKKMPEGYDTMCGERGAQMSGGQKQRIAIARALVRKPKILLLDEATSALDSESERVVQEALDRAAVGRTTLVIAHRLSTIRHAHMICAVRGGAVVETGTHDELVKRDGSLYAEMYKRQNAGFSQEANGVSGPSSVKVPQQQQHKDRSLGVGTAVMGLQVDAPTQLNPQMAHNSRTLQSAVYQPRALGGGEAGNVGTSYSIGPKGSVTNMQEVVIPPSSTIPPSYHQSSMQFNNVFPQQQHPVTTRQTPMADTMVTDQHEVDDKVTVSSSTRSLGEKEEMPTKDVKLVRLIKMSSPEVVYIIPALLCATVYGCQWPVFGLLFGRSMEQLQAARGAGELEEGIQLLAIGLVALGVSAGIAMVGQNYFFAIVGERLTKRLRQLSFRKLLTHGIPFFDMRCHSPGLLCTALSTQASEVRGASSERMGLLVQNVVCLIAGLTIAFIAGWKLTLVVLACLPFMTIGGYFENKMYQGGYEQLEEDAEESERAVAEMFANIRTVAAFTLEEVLLQDVDRSLGIAVHKGVRRARNAGCAFGFSQAIQFMVYGMGFWYGGKLVIDGEWDLPDSEIAATCPDLVTEGLYQDFDACKSSVNISYGFGRFMEVFFAIVMAGWGMGEAMSYASDGTKAAAAAGKIFALLDDTENVEDVGRQGADRIVTGALRFQNVAFRYPNRKEVLVLNGFTLDVPPGKTVALVGESGCGKSTTMQLLVRFYDPELGHISLDGMDIRSLDLFWLRKQIAVVSQEPLLFACSIMENIAYGKTDSSPLTMEEAQDVARKANAHDFVSRLPQGYDTQCGEKGAQLSGGQKQRIAIARALVRKPKILLLDEATSALDSESESVVQDALDRARVGRTTLVIAHRLATIRNSDAIAVVHTGRVAEIGTHDQLLSLNGFYTSLVKASGASAPAKTVD